MNDPLITTEALAAILGAPDLRLLDASWFLDRRDAEAAFRDAHIPGAAFFDIEAISDHSTDLPHMAAGPEQFAEAVGKLGVARDDYIVVYDQAGLFSAARVWWNLRHMGADKVQVLDGGLPKWRAEDRPIESGQPSPSPTTFAPAPRPDLKLDFDGVRQNIEAIEFKLLDARPAARFRGEAPEPRPGLASGHIPGSRSVAFGSLLNSDGTMKPAAELREVFFAAGHDPTTPAAVTCGSGVTAPIVALALARLGRWDVPVYDGSWAEWGSRTDAPIATQ